MEKKIAIQGGLGSFHHEAAKELFGNDLYFISKNHFREVTAAVENEECHAGLIAIENSIAGSILPNYSLIHKSNLYITHEVFLPVSMNLMVLPNVNLEDIEKVYSHPIALLQCDDFLENYPNIQRVEFDDTAKSAQKIKTENLQNAAAIASNAAAELYGLKILFPNIQTNQDSYTRFVLLCKQPNFVKDYDKISLRFTVSHKTGKLSNVLMQFTINQFNLTKIQSLPVPDSPWQYAFYIDLLVHNTELLDETLKIIDFLTEDLQILGKYKNANHIGY